MLIADEMVAPAEPDLAPEPPPDPEPGPAAEPEPASPSLRIGVLGSFTINGEPAALLPAQSQLILALALNGRDGLSNPQLCYLLGADPDHPRPSDSLRQLIVRTRRQLARAPGSREWIEHLGSGQYALHPAARFDWAEFDELAETGIRDRDASCLRSALRLIRGQPFAGCYYWWLDPALTETVRAQLVDAADLLAELELAAGDPAAAARAARTGLAGDSGAEQLWRALMRAEHAAGNSDRSPGDVEPVPGRNRRDRRRRPAASAYCRAVPGAGARGGAAACLAARLTGSGRLMIGPGVGALGPGETIWL